MKTTRYFLIAIAVLAIAGLTACTSEKKPETATAEVVRNVQVLTVAQSTVPDVLESMGSVQAAETAQLSVYMMGNVVTSNVHEGDSVRLGQVLAVLDDSQPRAG